MGSVCLENITLYMILLLLIIINNKNNLILRRQMHGYKPVFTVGEYGWFGTCVGIIRGDDLSLKTR